MVADEEVEEYPSVEVGVAGGGRARVVARLDTCSFNIVFFEAHKGVDEEGEDGGVGRSIVARLRWNV